MSEEKEQNGENVTVTISPKKKRQTQSEFVEEQLLKRLQDLSTLRGFSDLPVKARVYRSTITGGRHACPSWNAIMQDEDVGRIYGPGEYLVVYEIEQDDESAAPVVKSIRYNIGKEFAHVHREYCQDTGTPCLLRDDSKIPGQEFVTQKPGFLDSLTAEKIALFAAIVSAIKGLTSGSSGDFKTIIEGQAKIISAQAVQKQPQQLDLLGLIAPKLLERALDQPKQPDQISSMMSSLEALKAFKGMFNDGEDKGEGGGMMQVLLEKAMDVLPVLLAKNEGNAKQAGASLRDNQLVQAYINNPAAQKAFYTNAVAKIGEQKANELAAGLGIDPRRFQAAQQPAPAKIEVRQEPQTNKPFEF